MSKRSEARLAAILLCVACALGAAEKTRKRPVIDVTRQIALLPPKPVSLPGVPIRQVDVRLPLPKASPAPGDAWPFIARRGNRFIDAAVDLPKPYRPEPPNRAVLQHLDVDAKIEVDAVKVVSNLTALATLQLKTSTMLAAMRGDDVIFAAPGRIFLSSSDLQPRAALDGDFAPRLLSVDVLGRMHLIVGTGDKLSVWVVTPDGSRTVSRPLNPEYGPPIAPPIVGYDHRIHLVAADGIVTLDAYGDPLWERRPQGRVAGAGAAADDQLIVAAGRELQAYDGKGEREILFRSVAGALTTPPAMSASGEIFVATAEALFCLSRAK